MLRGRIKIFSWGLAIGWTLILGGILFYQIRTTSQFYVDLARNEARAHFDWVVTFRSWVASHGGVYAPITPATPPNIHLEHKVEERDITTPRGKPLTLINPAYMTRQILEQFAPAIGVHGHITSLKPIRPENKADQWETDALAAFEKGETERQEFTAIGGEPFLRLMRPLITEKPCMQCHESQGYKIGDIRGGLSISVPLTGYLAQKKLKIREHAAIQALLWLMGLGMIGLGSLRLLRQAEKREKAEQELRESEERLQVVTATANDAIVMVDGQGAVTFWNPAAEKMFGYTAQEMAGAKLHERIMPKKYVERHLEALRAFRERGMGETMGHTLEVEGLRKNGETFPVELSIAALWRKEGWRAVGVVREISERKKAEEALLLAKDKAEQATREKDKYISLIAHDLKAPFTSLMGFLQLMLRDEQSPAAGKYHHPIESVLENCHRTVGMIDEVLHASRFATGRVTLRQKFIDANMEAHAVIANFIHLAAQKRIGLVNEVPAATRLYADPALFGEVLSNLVSNAIKFTQAGGRVTIFAPRGPGAVVAVRDTGVGVDPALVPNLLRYDIKTTSVGTANERGTGLGLPYCKEIIEAHGGALTFDTEPGAGSTFYINLPYVRPRALIVDENEVDRYTMAKLLETLDVAVAQADGMAAAFAAAARAAPHLILLDAGVDGGGLAALGALKNDAKTKLIPVIMVTSDVQTEAREEALRLGADDFVEKPVTRENLIPRVRRFVV